MGVPIGLWSCFAAAGAGCADEGVGHRLARPHRGGLGKPIVELPSPAQLAPIEI